MIHHTYRTWAIKSTQAYISYQYNIIYDMYYINNQTA